MTKKTNKVKNVIAGMVAGVIITGMLSIGVLHNVNQKHIEELDNVTSSYEMEISKLEEVSKEYDELQNQVYNMKTGEPYEITVDHDGDTITWVSERGSLVNKGVNKIKEVKAEIEQKVKH